MHVVRKILKGTDLKNVVDIPSSLLNKSLELIIIPIEEQEEKKKNKKSLSGFLSKYANSDLIEREKNAWYEEAKE